VVEPGPASEATATEHVDVSGPALAPPDHTAAIDLTADELEPSDRAVTPSSERATELGHEHWRERAVIWRERAMAAELVVKMLQRNLDDLRANVDDLRLKVERAEAAEARRAAALESSSSPWRRLVRDLYEKYIG
jgi:hypothetical protein